MSYFYLSENMDTMLMKNLLVAEILLIEDNPADVRLMQEAMRESKIKNVLHVVRDGVEAISYLKNEGIYRDAVRPDLILLDLNLPRKDGRELLAEIKTDPVLKTIPVIILSTSEAEFDIVRSYELHANCYISKPVDLEQFMKVVQSIEHFWFTISKLPSLKN
jgi:chemotaxis family two-component system response regulator Rcp1